MRLLKIGGLLLLNLLIIALLLEIGLRLASPLLPDALAHTARRVMTGQPYAESWRPGWQENREHRYALRPGLDDALQYGSASVRFQLSTIALWPGAGIGVRNRPVDYFVDAVVVGDSFGLCFTARAACWVNQLEAQSGLGIVNLSQPVTGSISHLRMLQGFGAPLTPPLVIWQFFGNDFNDDYGLAVFRDELEPLPDASLPDTSASGLAGWLQQNSVAYALLEQTLTGQWGGLPAGERVFAMPHSVRYGEHTLHFGAAYERLALDMSREQNQLGYALSREAFAQAQALVDSWGGRLLVVMIPTREEVYAHLTAPIMGADALEAHRSARQAMQRLCEELNLTCLDPLDAFQARAAQNEALYFSDDMHLNPHGNAVLAAWLAEQLP